jgi:hypothetical protein
MPPLSASFCSRHLQHANPFAYRPSGDAAKLTLSETLRRAFRNASNVESQESCIHPGVSDTARARRIPRCSPSLSRQNQKEENGYKHGYENGHKNGEIHVSPLRTVYTSQGDHGSGHKGPFTQRDSRLLRQISGGAAEVPKGPPSPLGGSFRRRPHRGDFSWVNAVHGNKERPCRPPPSQSPPSRKTSPAQSTP